METRHPESTQPAPSGSDALPCISVDPNEIPADVMEECLETYRQSFSNQPCLLFSDFELQEWAPHRRPPDLVLYPMLALVLRTSKHPWLGDDSRKQHIIEGMSQRAWGLLASAYSSFHFEEPYYQGLCILGQADFAGKQS